MTRYADPHRCPDCRAAITPGADACGRCALSLRGDTAQRLFSTLVLADELLGALRAASVPAATGGVEAPFVPTPYPAVPSRGPARNRLSVASVPKILLALGAGCLLVAALVFLAVTWSVLGVGGRTATLVGFTVVAGALAAWMARRGLRAATEALALVGYGLLTLDLTGAERAGWFGDLSTSAFLGLLGAVLMVAGTAGAVGVRRTSLTGLTGAELVVAVGTALAALGVGTVDGLSSGLSLVLATALAAVVTAAAHRQRLLVGTLGAGAVAAVAWLSLTGYALDRVFASDPGWRALWLDLEVWPLLVSTGLVAGLSLLRRLPVSVRVGALAVAHLLFTGAVLAPTAYLDPTAVTLVAIGVLVAAGVGVWLLPRPWGLTSALTQAVGGTGVLMVGLALAARSAQRLGDAAQPVWAGLGGDRLPPWSGTGDEPAAWLVPLCVLAVVGTVWALAEASPAIDRVVTPLADLRVGAGLLAGSVVAALALYPAPLWLVLGVLLMVAAGFTAWWLASGSMVPMAVAAAFVGTALLVSLHAEWLTAATLCAGLVFSAASHLRSRAVEVAAAGGAVLAVTLGAWVWTWGAVLDADPGWGALAGLVTLGGLVLLAPYAPRRWSACPDPRRSRAALEIGTAIAAVALGGAGILRSPTGQESVWAAVYLTVAGVVASVHSLLQADRHALRWVGGALLAAASWVRLWDLGVSAPEAYTLPSAVALLLVGLDHLRRTPSSNTMTAMVPGLALALVPTLLWTLYEPPGLRALLLGIGCLLLVMAGARLGWTAPLVLGAAAGALLVLRLGAPYVGDAVPRWVLIGAAGVLLTALGATWERRLSEARSLVDYVRALR